MKTNKNCLIGLLFIGTHSLASGLVSPDKTIDGNEADNAQYVDMEVFCKTNPCRENVHFFLRTEQGKIDQQAPLYWPVVQNGRISVLSGEKVLVEGKLIGKQIKNFVAVKDSKQAMSFALQQDDEDLRMMLVIKNPYDYAIKVSIDLIDFEGALHETSSCPVMAGSSVFEMWPHPIPEMLISNIRKLDASESMQCVY